MAARGGRAAAGDAGGREGDGLGAVVGCEDDDGVVGSLNLRPS